MPLHFLDGQSKPSTNSFTLQCLTLRNNADSSQVSILGIIIHITFDQQVGLVAGPSANCDTQSSSAAVGSQQLYDIS